MHPTLRRTRSLLALVVMTLVASVLAAGQATAGAATTCQGQTVTVDLGQGDAPTTGPDVILGTNGVDRFLGTQGTLVTQAFTDGDVACLLGGNDEVRLFPLHNNLSIDLGDGNDRVTGSVSGSNGSIVRLGNGNDRVELDANSSGLEVDAGKGDDFVETGSGPDTIRGGSGKDTLRGGGGDDHITGGGGNDRLAGQDGNDTLNGGNGDDKLWGHAGNDTLWGGNGHDFLDGDGGADKLHGGTGNDVAWGDAGNDTVTGSAGNDELRGGDGADKIYGGTGADKLVGGNGDDTIEGQDGDDEILGYSGDDRLLGGDGNDVLNGGNGGDQLDGGSGWDQLWGGGSNDLLDGGPHSGSADGGSGSDTCVNVDSSRVSCEDGQTVGTDRTGCGNLVCPRWVDGAEIVEIGRVGGVIEVQWGDLVQPSSATGFEFRVLERDATGHQSVSYYRYFGNPAVHSTDLNSGHFPLGRENYDIEVVAVDDDSLINSVPLSAAVNTVIQPEPEPSTLPVSEPPSGAELGPPIDGTDDGTAASTTVIQGAETAWDCTAANFTVASFLHSFTIGWNHKPGAVEYRVTAYRYDSAYSLYVQHGPTERTSNSIARFDRLFAATDYSVSIAALNSAGQRIGSCEVAAATIDLGIPNECRLSSITSVTPVQATAITSGPIYEDPVYNISEDCEPTVNGTFHVGEAFVITAEANTAGGTGYYFVRNEGWAPAGIAVPKEGWIQRSALKILGA